MFEQPYEVFVLFETAAGYILLLINEWDTIAQSFNEVQDSLLDITKFNNVVKVKAVYPFVNAESALEACQAVANGESTEVLRSFLDQNLPKKRKKCKLAVIDPALGKNLAQHGFPVLYDKNILELIRFCNFHVSRLIKQFGVHELFKFQIGLGHSFTRSKLQMDPNRQDKPVQNAIALIENLDKSINTFAMRVREWYSWHFPELAKIVTDNIKFVQAACLIRVKEDFDASRYEELVQVVDGNEELAQEIMTAKDISMGQDIIEFDMINIERFANEVIKLADQRQKLLTYLSTKLSHVAPNLQTLLGDALAAKLIAHAGSLTNLAKYPASTVQILGAEKALFRALKSKGNTPKYGLLFQSTFIGRAAQKNKGRISRYLANKCSLAARIDQFAPIPSNIFGVKLRDQVEERINYLTSGVITAKNILVMKNAAEEYYNLLKNSEMEHKTELQNNESPIKFKKHDKKKKKIVSITEEKKLIKKKKTNHEVIEIKKEKKTKNKIITSTVK